MCVRACVRACVRVCVCVCMRLLACLFRTVSTDKILHFINTLIMTKTSTYSSGFPAEAFVVTMEPPPSRPPINGPDELPFNAAMYRPVGPMISTMWARTGSIKLISSVAFSHRTRTVNDESIRTEFLMQKSTP